MRSFGTDCMPSPAVRELGRLLAVSPAARLIAKARRALEVKVFRACA